MIKPLLISTSDLSGGGAFKAAYRLHEALRGAGSPSQMLVQSKASDDPEVFTTGRSGGNVALSQRFRSGLDRLPLRLLARGWKKTEFSLAWVPDNIPTAVRHLKPDVVNVHWICDGFMQVESLARMNRPVVLTLHDMWMFTGGCNYNQGCERFREKCGGCPQLGSAWDWDLSRINWMRKVRTLSHAKQLLVVTPSHWLARQAASSSLLSDTRIEVIPYSISLKKFRPLDKKLARRLLQLPEDKHLVLFGALDALQNRRKGYALLQQALQHLASRELPVELLIFGGSRNTDAQVPQRAHYLGRLHDELLLVLAYSAADVFVAPSLEDNLPNTVIEALACGTPCVAFKIGGMVDLIEPNSTGYLAEPFDPADLAAGIARILESGDDQPSWRQRARASAELRFSHALQAERYISLFERMLNAS